MEVLNNNSNDNIVLEKGKEYILCISPDMPTFYPIVQLFKKYNPLFISAGEHIDMPQGNFIRLRKEPFVSVQELAKELLHSEKVSSLIEALRTHQGEIWVKMWCNHEVFQPFFNKPGIKSLGFSPKEAKWLNNKIIQYNLLKDVVPITDFIITKKNEALSKFDVFKTEKGVITLLSFSAAGSGVKIHGTKKELERYFDQIDDEKLILAKIIKKKSSPSVDIIVANEKENVVFGLADQVLKGLQSLGATYPTKLDKSTQKKCYDIARLVSFAIAKKGIRGYFSIDMIIDENDNVFFSEINGRYTGNTATRLWAMEQSRPSKHPSILDMEVMAVRDGTFHGFKIWDEPKQLFWYKRLIRMNSNGVIQRFAIAHDIRKVYEKRDGIVLIGQLKAGTKVLRQKTELGNFIIVKKSRAELDKAIKEVDTLLKQYVKVLKN